MRREFIFLYFDSLICQSVKQQFKMLVVFSLIFVVDTKIIFRYNFVAPLICQCLTYITFELMLKLIKKSDVDCYIYFINLSQILFMFVVVASRSYFCLDIFLDQRTFRNVCFALLIPPQTYFPKEFYLNVTKLVQLTITYLQFDVI